MAYPHDKDLDDCVVLSVGTSAPPRCGGGLDQSMWSLATRMTSRVAENHMLAVATSDSDAYDDVLDGVHIMRRRFDRPAPAIAHGQPMAVKAAFQIADHLLPGNVDRFARVLDQVRPDIVLVHSLVGIGLNVVSALASRDLRVIFYLHELGLACINRAMFRNGRTCAGWCAPCRASSAWQAQQHDRLRHVAYISPSQANLDKVAEHFDFQDRPTYTILNANAYPAPRTPRIRNEGPPRLIFVGRVDREKGVPFILSVLAELAIDHPFNVRIVGDGAELAMLRSLYADADWCEFLGWRPQTEIADLYADSDLMLAPSLWSENAPGAVVHAQSCGTPVLGSDGGGLKGVIENGATGLLLAIGDADAWRRALAILFQDRASLDVLIDGAERLKDRFDATKIFAQHLEVIEGTRHV